MQNFFMHKWYHNLFCNKTFYSYYSNQQLLYWLLDSLQLATHYYTFICTMVIDNLFMHYCNWLLLYALLQLTTFVWTVATKDYCMLQTSINNISYIDCNYAHKLITAFLIVYELVWTGIRPCRAAITASNNHNNNHTLTTA